MDAFLLATACTFQASPEEESIRLLNRYESLETW